MRGIVAAILTTGAYVAAHALCFHLVAVRRRLAVMLGLWVLGIAGYAVLWAALPDDAAWLPRPLVAGGDPVSWLNGLFLYWALFAGYYQFVNMADNSVGVRSLVELARLDARGVTLAGLETRYPYTSMVDLRLGRLVAAGFLTLGTDGRYRCTTKGRVAARVFRRLKVFLALGPGG